MNAQSVIMIAYFFPPEGNAAVYRPMRFLKELVKSGWHVTLISSEPYRYERYDPALVEQVPPAVRVVRVRGRDPWRAFQSRRGTQATKQLSGLSAEEVRQVVATHHSPWRSRMREWVRIAETLVYRPDMAMPWIKPAVRASMDVCQRHRPNVIWATIGPLSAGVVAYRTSVATGIPYVLDFRDPWGLEYYPHEMRRPAWAKDIDNRNIRRLFQGAQAVVFMFESVAEAYRQAFPGALERTKIHIIPNGFEGDVEPFVHTPGDRCTILYAGTLSTYRYDTLLEGLVQLKRQDPSLAARLKMLFIGEGLQHLAERVTDLELGDIFEIRPPIPSAEVRLLQREAHALLVLGRMPGRTAHDLVAGAKLFGYLQAGRPIVGIVPHDETRRILGQVGSSLIADADTPSEVVTIIEKVLKSWSNRTLEQLIPDRIVCEAYSSHRQITDLIAALQGASPGKIPTVESPTVQTDVKPEVAR
ncbi:MAG: glycosyltransferase [Nitrospira sp.]